MHLRLAKLGSMQKNMELFPCNTRYYFLMNFPG